MDLHQVRFPENLRVVCHVILVDQYPFLRRDHLFQQLRFVNREDGFRSSLNPGGIYEAADQGAVGNIIHRNEIWPA